MPKSKLPYIASTLNISLILFFLGIFFFLAIAAQLVLDQAVQELEFKIILAEQVSQAQANQIRKQIQKQPFTVSTSYVSKNQALQNLKDIGDDFLEAMDGMNPLPAVINLRLKPEYVNIDSIEKISQILLEYPEIVDLYYPISLIQQLQKNLVELRWIAFVLAIVLVIVTFFLILNTVKLSIYAKRLMIRTMQLIGATENFIQAPFLKIGILQGAIGGCVASILLILLLLGIDYTFEIHFFHFLIHNHEIWVLFFCLILLGLSLGYFSSKVAIRKFLNKELDQII
ncbi:MAG: permease-like cell division protein FtsX [Bacteroidia bacterium]|nr:permease-like cell division protein FtsX [Bacteroidia bacterium]MDW8157654.1 permease-like cell division protein FtsX [Bacteroidia bacterium]